MARAPEHDVELVRAENPGPLTLAGTNTWLVGRDPTWIVDPGPDLASHVEAVLVAAEKRGGVGGIVVTHDHPDHAGAVPIIKRHSGAPVAASPAGGVPIDHALADGAAHGPFTVYATPGHAHDHLAYVAGSVVFTGDAVLGEGSVFVAPAPGALSSYLDALDRLRRLQLELLCPGHGPLVRDPRARFDEYIAHRNEREQRLIAALDAGLRTEDELLDAVWSDAPDILRPAAGLTLAAHLAKLADEGRLPDGVDLESGRRRWEVLQRFERG
jgi:glyoxylase-like metal-dependent hydrolase (beta-lactamase superfamily II)